MIAKKEDSTKRFKSMKEKFLCLIQRSLIIREKLPSLKRRETKLSLFLIKIKHYRLSSRLWKARFGIKTKKFKGYKGRKYKNKNN